MDQPHEPPQAHLMGIIAGYWLSQAVFVAARLKIADVISGGKITLDEIARATGTKADSLKRTMRALTVYPNPDALLAAPWTPLHGTLRLSKDPFAIVHLSALFRILELSLHPERRLEL
jgi:hypothetical protein